MSAHSLSPVTKKDAEQIAMAAPFNIGKGPRITLYVLMALGVASLVYGLLQENPTHVWLSLLVSFLFWFCVSAAQTLWGAVLHIANAQWSRPIRRLFESGAPFFRYSWIGIIALYFGHEYIYEWASLEYVTGKGAWLTSEFFFSREIIVMFLFGFLGWTFTKLSVGRDVIAGADLVKVSDEHSSRWKALAAGTFKLPFAGNAISKIKSTNLRMWRLAPIFVAVYAVAMTLVAFDLVMSIDYHWFSTLFGALIFMSAIYIAMAWASMCVGFAREIHPLFRAKIERRTLHDLGKLLFGFGIFWAYMFWSHYLPIWYSNMPEFTGWMIVRTRVEPWHSFAWIILGSCFIIPFLLGLSRDVKQTPILLFATGAIVMMGVWLQFYLLVFPTLYPNEIPLNLMDVLIFFGFGALYALTQANFLAKVPLMPFGDFYDDEDQGAQMAA